MAPAEHNTNSKVNGMRALRISDPDGGKTCHQCRQKTNNLTATCKALKKKWPCNLTFCPRCLLNRYGENVEDAGKVEIWKCPKCCGICNCSVCMTNRGFQPTGILADAVKAQGYNSVHDFLCDKGVIGRKHRNTNSAESNDKGSLNREMNRASKKLKAGELINDNKGDTLLSIGMPLTTIADIELKTPDVGYALPFMQFRDAVAEEMEFRKKMDEIRRSKPMVHTTTLHYMVEVDTMHVEGRASLEPELNSSSGPLWKKRNHSSFF